MNKRKKAKKTFWKPVAVGFAALYLTTMFWATFLVKEKFADEYGKELEQYAISVLNKASAQEFAVKEGEWEGENWKEKARKNFYQKLSNEYLWMIDNPFAGVSAAFYDEEKHLLARSRSEMEISLWTAAADSKEDGALSFGLQEYLSKEEVEKLAAFEMENIQSQLSGFPGPYRFLVSLSPDGQSLLGIMVQEVVWEETPPEGLSQAPQYQDPFTGRACFVEMGESVDFATGQPYGEPKSYYESDSRILWEWNSLEQASGQEKTGETKKAGVFFPYINLYYQSADVYERWKKWSDSSYLQNFPETGEFTWEKGLDAPPLEVDGDGFYYRARYRLKNGMVDDPFGYVEIRMEAMPWLEAAGYMRYIYLAGLVLTLACMGKVIFAFHQISQKQAALEETRRDFINAMAHEMKTPLGIIRNFAENLLEHNREEKRDYYLSQIIGQTEEMDGLVTEMAGISKLDSEGLELRKEGIFFSELIREQMGRFQTMIREKDLHVRYEEKADFRVSGDREYLARAVWNLCSNAVDYNLPGGNILIRIEKERCSIENTGFPIDAEQLDHAFDLFYTEDKSRGGKDRHMGTGLFLAKKILKLHGLSLSLENTQDGVRAVIKEL